MSPRTPEDRRPTIVAGRPMGVALLAAGLALGGSRAIARIVEGPQDPARVAAAILEAGALALGSGLVGMAIELAASIASARLDEEDRAERARMELAERAVAALEKLAESPLRSPPRAKGQTQTEDERARLLAEIDQSLRPGRLAEAGALLERFAAEFPDDPAIAAWAERLDAARREEAEGALAGIRAAKEVNDPARVLELYRGLCPAIDSERRGDLERELSRWFLEVIHRRLRGGRIQAEVVELATSVADTFSRTIEGASLHASLPTLRRSVGLCPRCASPYAGTAAACPKCLAPSVAGPDSGRLDHDPDPEPDEDEIPTESASGGGPDADWVFYDEDDRDGPPRIA